MVAHKPHLVDSSAGDKWPADCNIDGQARGKSTSSSWEEKEVVTLIPAARGRPCQLCTYLASQKVLVGQMIDTSILEEGKRILRYKYGLPTSVKLHL